MRLRDILLLFLFAQFAFAAQPLNLTFAVPIVAIIVIAGLAFANMISHSISDPRFEAWVKTEMREFFAGVLIIAIITGSLIGANGVAATLSGTPDFIGASQTILNGWLTTYDSAFADIIRAATRIRTAATYSPYMNIPIWYLSINYSTNTLGGIAILLGPLNMAAQGLTNLVFLSEGVLMLLIFLKIVGPNILLPMAFTVRLIPFSRKLGNTLIAIAVAGMVFLPLSVIIANALNGTITMPNPQIDLDELDADPWAMVMAEPLCEAVPVRSLLFVTEQIFSAIVCLPLLLTPWTIGLYQAPCREPLMHQVVYPLIQLIFQIVNTVILLLWEITYSAGMDDVYAEAAFDAIFGFLAQVNNLALLGYIDFILIGTMTLVMARGLSTALGGEWYMAGVSRLI